MPAERNQPDRLFAYRDPDVGYGYPTEVRESVGQIEYLRRDLVVPTVDEIASAIAGDPDWEFTLIADDVRAEAHRVRAVLLSRIEGDNDGQ